MNQYIVPFKPLIANPTKWSDTLCKSMQCVLYDKDLRHEKVKFIRIMLFKFAKQNNNIKELLRGENF